MFKKTYLISSLRNFLILTVMTPLLSAYVMATATRIMESYRESTLSYITNTGDYSQLKSPTANYNYYYFTTDNDYNPVYISNISILKDEKERYVRSVKRFHVYGNIMNLYISRPEGFHHRWFDNYYFSSIMQPVEGGYLFHVIYNDDGIAFSMILDNISRANKTFVFISVVISLLFAYFEHKPARRAWMQQKHFIAQTSHDLRTPITVINTALENTEKSGLSNWAKNSGIIKREVDHMISMVDDLMFLSRVDARQIRLQKGYLDISTTLLEAYISAEILADTKTIKFEDFEPCDIDIYADETMIKRLIMILLENAIDFTGHGGTVSLSCVKKSSKVIITVGDTGIGIDKKEFKQIFKRFYSVDESRSGQKGNSGLGLSIAKWIVERHHGSIKVESTVGQGSKFIVTLPIKRGLRDFWR